MFLILILHKLRLISGAFAPCDFIYNNFYATTSDLKSQIDTNRDFIVRPKEKPVTVETQSVHGATGAESQGVTRLVDDAGKGVSTGNTGQSIFRTMAPVDQVGQIPLREKHTVSAKHLEVF